MSRRPKRSQELMAGRLVILQVRLSNARDDLYRVNDKLRTLERELDEIRLLLNQKEARQ